jgi:Flp pilus assembly protein TadG
MQGILKMMNIKMLRSFIKAESGMAAVEFAFIVPVMLLLYFGLIDITGLVSLNRKVTASAAITADLVGQQKTSVLKPLIMDQYNATAMIMSPTSITNVRVEVFGYRNVGGTPTKIWHTSNNQGPACGVDPDITNMLPLMAATNDLVVARTCTTFTPYVISWMSRDAAGNSNSIKVLASDSFLVKQAIVVRPRSSLQLTCYESVVGGALCT